MFDDKCWPIWWQYIIIQKLHIQNQFHIKLLIVWNIKVIKSSTIYICEELMDESIFNAYTPKNQIYNFLLLSVFIIFFHFHSLEMFMILYQHLSKYINKLVFTYEKFRHIYILSQLTSGVNVSPVAMAMECCTKCFIFLVSFFDSK